MRLHFGTFDMQLHGVAGRSLPAQGASSCADTEGEPDGVHFLKVFTAQRSEPGNFESLVELGSVPSVIFILRKP